MIDRAAFLKSLGGLFTIAVLDTPVARGAMLVAPHHHSHDPLKHPEPRPDISADHVLSLGDLGASPKKDVVAAYDAARERPQLFDGIACGCGCSEKGGEHRSLLVCYETKQPTGCAACRLEATFVGDMAKDGKTLAEIRVAVDKKFG